MKNLKLFVFTWALCFCLCSRMCASVEPQASPEPKKRSWMDWLRPSTYNPVRGVNEAAKKIASDVATTTASLAPVLEDMDSLLAPAVKPDGSEPIMLSDMTGHEGDANVPVTVLGAVVDGVTKARVEQVDMAAKERLEQIDAMICKYAKYGAAALIAALGIYLSL